MKKLIKKHQNGAKLSQNIQYKVGDYYYKKNDGTIVVIPKEFYERNKGKSYWKGIENAVNATNNSFREAVEHGLSDYRNYREFNSYLPEGYSFRNSGLIVSSNGTYYVPSFYKETNRVGINREASPLQFTIYPGKPIEKQLTYYPIYDKKPLDTAENNTIKVLTENDFEKQYAPIRDFKSEGDINTLRYYAPTNPEADTSGYVYKQVLREPEPEYDWDNYDKESYKIYSNQLNNWFDAYDKSLKNILVNDIPEGFNTITEQTFKTLYSDPEDKYKDLVKTKYENPAIVLKGRTLPVKYFSNGYGDYKKGIYLPDGTDNVFAKGGRLKLIRR